MSAVGKRRRVRGLGMVLVSLAFALGATGVWAAASEDPLAALGFQAPDRPRAAPAFALPDLRGRIVRSTGLVGRPALVSFFATWCPACRSEMPALAQLAREFRDTDLMFLLINYGEGRQAVEAFASQFALEMPVLLDRDEKVGDASGVRFLPTHVLIGRRGEVLGIAVGPKAWEGAAARRLLRSILARPSESAGRS